MGEQTETVGEQASDLLSTLLLDFLINDGLKVVKAELNLDDTEAKRLVSMFVLSLKWSEDCSVGDAPLIAAYDLDQRAERRD